MVMHAVHICPRKYAVPVPLARVRLPLGLRSCFAPQCGQKGVSPISLWQRIHSGTMITPIHAYYHGRGIYYHQGEIPMDA